MNRKIFRARQTFVRVDPSPSYSVKHLSREIAEHAIVKKFGVFLRPNPEWTLRIWANFVPGRQQTEGSLAERRGENASHRPNSSELPFKTVPSVLSWCTHDRFVMQTPQHKENCADLQMTRLPAVFAHTHMCTLLVLFAGIPQQSSLLHTDGDSGWKSDHAESEPCISCVKYCTDCGKHTRADHSVNLSRQAFLNERWCESL